jgi:hypothetical protein
VETVDVSLSETNAFCLTDQQNHPFFAPLFVKITSVLTIKSLSVMTI